MLKHRGERPLLVGFAACVIAGFLGTVMTGTIVLTLLGPVALGSIAAGVYQARDHSAPLYRQAIALAVIILGFWALLWMSQETVRVAYRWAVASLPYARGRGQIPPLEDWLQIAGGWIVPALLWGVQKAQKDQGQKHHFGRGLDIAVIDGQPVATKQKAKGAGGSGRMLEF